MSDRTAKLRDLLAVVGPGNLALVVLLAAASGWLITQPDSDGGLLALLLLEAGVGSLLLIRRRPVAAAAIFTTSVLLTQLVTGPLVTCGVILPTLSAMAFILGSRSMRAGAAVAVAAAISTGAVAELVLDPVLGDLGSVVVVVALVGGFLAAGLVVRSRRRLLDVLQRRTAELARQRDRTAALAVEADRARVGADLELTISARLDVIADAADQGRFAAMAGATEQTRAALGEVEREGRETLARMRAVVGELHQAPTAPTPGLPDLRELLARSVGDARLQVVGHPRAIGPHLELAAYRIVEQLVSILGENPTDRVDVTLRFDSDSLYVRVAGPRQARVVARTADDRVREERGARLALATGAARARAEVVGGRVLVGSAVDRDAVDVVLPLPAALVG